MSTKMFKLNSKLDTQALNILVGLCLDFFLQTMNFRAQNIAKKAVLSVHSVWV